MLDVKMIERGLAKPGKTKGGLADAMGVRPGWCPRSCPRRG